MKLTRSLTTKTKAHLFKDTKKEKNYGCFKAQDSPATIKTSDPDESLHTLQQSQNKTTQVVCKELFGLFPYFPIGSDCSKFINCLNGKPMIMKCSPGTLFSSINGICDGAANVICNGINHLFSLNSEYIKSYQT